MCKETPGIEKCQASYFWRDVSIPVLPVSVSISVSRDLFDFVFFCKAFFLRLSLMQILTLVVLSFCHFEGSFHFWGHLWGLVLRPFSTCSSLMSFSPFSCFLWLLSLLVASFFCSLLSRASWGSVLLLATFSFLFFCFCFSWAVFHPVLSFTGSVLSSLQSLDPLTF